MFFELYRKNLMKILIIGDIFGYAGKRIIMENLPFIKTDLKIDVVIANAENVSNNGKGLNYKDYCDLKDFGIDYFTLGNHAFKDKDIYNFIDEVDNLVRPANLKKETAGKEYLIFNFNNKRILLFNLLGRELMNRKQVTSPFEKADEILDNVEYDLAILDFHAETTSEKKVLSYYLRDKVKIFYGTHTHIQTSDEEILNDQAYITDLGMVGISDSAIGIEYEGVLDRMLEKNKFSSFKEKESGIKTLNSILVSLYDNTLIPYNIERINLKIK